MEPVTATAVEAVAGPALAGVTEEVTGRAGERAEEKADAATT